MISWTINTIYKQIDCLLVHNIFQKVVFFFRRNNWPIKIYRFLHAFGQKIRSKTREIHGLAARNNLHSGPITELKTLFWIASNFNNIKENCTFFLLFFKPKFHYFIVFIIIKVQNVLCLKLLHSIYLTSWESSKFE